MQAVKRVTDDRDGGVEAEGHVRGGEIVVNRLGDADEVQAQAGKLVGNVHRAITADHDQHIQPRLLVSAHCLERGVLNFNFSGCHLNRKMPRVPFVRGAEDRSTQAKNTGNFAIGQFVHPPCDQTLKAVFNADHRRTELAHGGFGHGAYDGIEAGTIAEVVDAIVITTPEESGAIECAPT